MLLIGLPAQHIRNLKFSKMESYLNIAGCANLAKVRPVLWDAAVVVDPFVFVKNGTVRTCYVRSTLRMFVIGSLCSRVSGPR